MKLVYVAGKYTAKTTHEVQRNINIAWDWGCEIAKAGAFPVIPHCNTSQMQDIQSPEFWYEGTLELLKRCDAIYMLRDWEDSRGAKVELSLAKELGLEVIFQASEEVVERFRIPRMQNQLSH